MQREVLRRAPAGGRPDPHSDLRRRRLRRPAGPGHGPRGRRRPSGVHQPCNGCGGVRRGLRRRRERGRGGDRRTPDGVADGVVSGDRVALVTGASRGIGRAIAEALADSGYAVGICARLEEIGEVAAELREAGAVAEAWRVDVTDTLGLRRFVDGAAERFGRIDVLVNNAGMNRAGYIREVFANEVDAMFAVNVRAPLVAMQAVVPHMVAAGGGRIVNIASWVARSPRPGFVAYSASKAALVALTQGAALEFADSGITVNAVCPGNVLTDIWETSIEGTSLEDGTDVEKLYAESVAAQPIKRGVTAEEVAEAVLFLCSEGAASITGEAIAVASGL
ncbi:MAG: SDR family oxidoreductase [Acidimicrobiia bacterium]|nr:SDR family oxidoreductase [Acidimicrobiia bacterium]